MSLEITSLSDRQVKVLVEYGLYPKDPVDPQTTYVLHQSRSLLDGLREYKVYDRIAVKVAVKEQVALTRDESVMFWKAIFKEDMDEGFVVRRFGKDLLIKTPGNLGKFIGAQGAKVKKLKEIFKHAGVYNIKVVDG